jgi:hypothetical protein
MPLVDKVAQLITLMSLVGDDEKKEDLRIDARDHTLEEWKLNFKVKVTSVGALVGGAASLAPVIGAIAMEIPDITYLMVALGRSCYGIGYIIRNEVDYENDIPKILALWCGVARSSNELVQGSALAFKTKPMIAAKIAGATLVPPLITGTIVAVHKFGPKLMGKVAAKAASKFMAKFALRMSWRWIPFFGAIASGGVNYWIANGLMQAAELYYTSEYIVVDPNFAADVEEASK